jgi:group I intron endonuclease
LQKAWNKYGKDSFSFEVLEYCEFDQCRIREDYYCKLYSSHITIKGFNLRPTGISLKAKFSEDLKQKIREDCINSEKYKNRDCGKGMRGKHHTKESCIKISEGHFGIISSPETRQKMSNSAKGRIRSRISIEKQIQARHANGSVWHTEKTLINMRAPKLKSRSNSKYNFQNAIEQLDCTGNTIEVYENIDSIPIEFNKYSILGVCNNERKTHKKFIWKYKQN